MAADAFERGEHPRDEASDPVCGGNVACGPVRLGVLGEVVGMMFVGAEVLCGIAGRFAEECGVGRRSRVADVLRAFSRLVLIGVARDRAAGAGALRAAR